MESPAALRQPVRVLVLESIFHLGGAERITYEIVRRLDARYRPVLCTLYQPGPIGDLFIDEGYKFYKHLARHKFDLAVLPKLLWLIRNEKIDLIYLINQPLTLFWGTLVSRLCNVPIIPVIHNTFITDESLKLRIYRILLPLADRIIAVAHSQKKHLIERERLPAHLIRVIHNGIDASSFAQPLGREEKARQLSLDPSKPTIGIITRLVYLKGIDIFLKAAHIVLQIQPEAQFLIVGDGPERQALSRLAAELGIQRNIVFLGQRHDVNEIIPVFDIAILSSRTEALPMVLLEYMACQKPIVATRVGSVPEVIANHQNGFIIESENPLALAQAICKLLDNPVLAEKMGQESQSRIDRCFQIEKTVTETQAVFDEVLATRAK